MKSVLVVDDMAVFREPIEALVREAGYIVRGADSGRDALTLMEREKPDLVLLDIVMPNVDGLHVLSMMRKNPNLVRVPVIVLTSAGQKDRVREAARLGISGYVLKAHFSSRDILSRIKSHLEPADEPPAGVRAGANVGGKAPPASHAATTPRAVPRVTSPGALDALTPIMKREDVLQRVTASSELKGISPVVAQVLKLTGDPDCSTDSVARVISQDPAVALKVLKLANSSVYARGDTVDSVQKAVVRIGMDRIRQCVLNVSVVEQFSEIPAEGSLSVPHFWEHSIGCGIIAARLARTTAPNTADAAFTLGLLHDLGRAVFAQQLGERYAKVVATARSHSVPLEQAETWMLRVNHADVMDTLLRGWNFPRELISPILLHHSSPGSIRAAAPQQLMATISLALANRLAHAMLLGSSGNDTVYPTEELCVALHVDAGVVAEIERTVGQETEDMRLAMLSQLSTAGWSRYRDEVRQQIRLPLRPLFVGEQPGLDAYRIFCHALAEPATKEPPNIAVVHAQRGVDLPRLATTLREAEAGAGAKDLPVLLLWGAAPTDIDEGFSRDRVCLGLTTPLCVRSFVSAANQALSK